LKFTVGSAGVFVNQAEITAVDVQADNGVVHVLDAVVLPVETVADVAIDNGFTSLVAVVVEARLLPALTNPFASLTVFAPTNDAFEDLATALGTDINGVLESPSLTEILLYHVVGSAVLSTELSAGSVATLNGQDVVIDLTSGVKVNDATVILADVEADNGVVHVIDAVLVPSLANLTSVDNVQLTVYPNPVIDIIRVKGLNAGSYELIDLKGTIINKGDMENGVIEISDVMFGTYMLRLKDSTRVETIRIVKQ
jgi:uncharacterized surface protein with fasciclin (FAS1) repeats